MLADFLGISIAAWVIIGIVVLVVLVGSLIRFFPAIMAAIFVLMFTGSWLLAGLAFLTVAVIMAIVK